MKRVWRSASVCTNPGGVPINESAPAIFDWPAKRKTFSACPIKCSPLCRCVRSTSAGSRAAVKRITSRPLEATRSFPAKVARRHASGQDAQERPARVCISEICIHAIDMKLGERGQVTVPKALRDRFGLKGSTEVEFVEEGGELILRKKVSSQPRTRRARVASCFGALKEEPEDVDRFIEEIRGR